MNSTDYSNTPSNSDAASVSTFLNAEKQFAPSKCEEYVENNLDRMYIGNAPTLRKFRETYGDDATNLWLTEQLAYMFELTEVKLDHLKSESLVRLIRAKYPWLKVTEFMHYVFLFRTGEFGRIYGKADGQTVMLTLKDYMAIRENILAEIRRRNDKPKPFADNPRMETPTATSKKLYKLIQAENENDLGKWRKEPWASVLTTWYHCKLIPSVRAMNIPLNLILDFENKYFPGYWSEKQREEFAVRLGYKHVE